MTYVAGTSLAQVSGLGTVVSIGGVTGASGTETFTPIGEVSDAKFSGKKKGVTTTTNFASLGVVTKVGTTLDYGQFTCTLPRIPNDTGQMAVLAAIAANANYDFEVVLPINALIGQTAQGDKYTFSAVVSEAGDFDISLTKISEYNFTFDISGAVTFTAGS
jgi:hypothetical protein